LNADLEESMEDAIRKDEQLVGLKSDLTEMAQIHEKL
jgi:hypothetical protein